MAIRRYNKEAPNQPDEVTGAQVTIDTDHQSIHLGAMYNLTYWDSAVVSGGTIVLGFEVPTGLRVAFKSAVALGFGWYWTFQVEPFTSYTESGTFLTPNNHNVSTDAVPSLVKVNLNPTGYTTTFPLGFVFGGGTGVAGTGSSSGGRLDDEYGFSAGKHVVVITNNTGATGLGQVQLTWIERYTY